MKKLIVFVSFCCIVLVITIAMFAHFQSFPTPVIPTDSDVVLLRIEYMGSLDNVNIQDVTCMVAANDVITLLMRSYSIMDLPNPFPIWLGDVIWEIHVSLNSWPMHFVLGRDSFHYSCASETTVHRIVDPELLMKELGMLVWGVDCQ